MKLTLDRKATYQIKVPGEIRKKWLGWNDKINVERGIEKYPITTITCVLDQAGLHGFLRRLYAMGLPLIEVVCIDCPGVDNR